MGRNIIYYGVPGTGKTYLLQNIISKYKEYSITDQNIIEARNRYSHFKWLVIALIILQKNKPLSSDEIASKIANLFPSNNGIDVSSELEKHSNRKTNLAIKHEKPCLFSLNANQKWYADAETLRNFDNNIFSRFIKPGKNRYRFVTFHQAFSYEDFVEGIRPTFDYSTQNLDYSPKPGIFKIICAEAQNNPEERYAIFIDEINRGNIAEIFGELISLIEEDKRKGEPNELTAYLPYSKEEFVVPSNLDIYGTMNSADKSVSQIDSALRRRFEFIKMEPSSEVIRNVLADRGIDATNIDGVNLIKLFNTLNDRLILMIDENHTIGHSFFLNVRTWEDIKEVIVKNVIPLLEEYFFDDLIKIQHVFNETDETRDDSIDIFYPARIIKTEDLLSNFDEFISEEKKVYTANESFSKAALIKIYQ